MKSPRTMVAGNGFAVASDLTLCEKRFGKMSKKQKRKHFGKIKADPTKQAPNNSYCPPLEYEDISFSCIDCGASETWIAEQQRVYFEEWKKPIYHQPRRCRACRTARQKMIVENNRETAIGLRAKTASPNKSRMDNPH